SNISLMESSQPITLTLESGLQPPLYQQIYLLIRDRIMSGEYPDQSLLPSEHETAKMFGVSRITSKRALNEVAAEGLCVRKRGQGTRVTYRPAGGPLKSDAQGLLDVFSNMNLQTEGQVLDFEYIPAEQRIASILEIEESAEVQRSVRTRRLDGKPLSYLTTYVPADLGRRYERKHLVHQAAVTLLEKTGVEIAGAEQTITATLAEAVAAEALEIKQGAPLLRISRVVRDHEHRVVEYIVGLYRPDQFQYDMFLSRINSGGRQSWAAK
ncbi:GntR family transcriptional regulator, partial [Pseudomonadota bacterium]